jgi:cell division protease FtsH
MRQVPDQQSRRQTPARGRSDPPNRFPPGWRVTPAPDGRGGEGKSPTPPTRANSRWLVVLLILGLLALNLWISSQALQPNARVRIPYSPTFLNQVQGNNVKDIASTANSIQGTFYHALKYGSSQPTTSFSTQVPSFANGSQLSQLLEQHKVTINANPPSGGPSLIESLIFGFGPTLLLVLLFVFVMRRAAGAAGGAGGLMSFGRSRARRVEGSE